MFHLLSPVKSLVRSKPIAIDNYVFQLHYKVTSLILAVSSIVVAAFSFNKTIHCHQAGVPDKVMNNFCWAQSTFSIAKTLKYEEITRTSPVAFPGGGTALEGDSLIHHDYYQWVIIVLFCQAVLFYFPRFVWKYAEGGKCEALVSKTNAPILSQEEKRSTTARLVSLLKRYHHSHSIYACKFLFCELLNLVNIVSQIILTDLFLGGRFISYPMNVWKYETSTNVGMVNPRTELFPKVTKCDFKKYGPSGTDEKLGGICLLLLNVVNEKVYLVLSVWFVLLLALTTLHALYRLLTLLSPRLRLFVLRLHAPRSSPADLQRWNDLCHFGDWLMLRQLCRNMEPFIFSGVIHQLAASTTARDQDEDSFTGSDSCEHLDNY